MIGVDRSGQRRNGPVAGRPKRFGRVASGAEDWFTVRNHAAIKTLCVEPARREGFLVKRGMLRKLLFIMQPQNVQPKITFGQAIPEPARRGFAAACVPEA